MTSTRWPSYVITVMFVTLIGATAMTIVRHPPPSMQPTADGSSSSAVSSKNNVIKIIPINKTYVHHPSGLQYTLLFLTRYDYAQYAPPDVTRTLPQIRDDEALVTLEMKIVNKGANAAHEIGLNDMRIVEVDEKEHFIEPSQVGFSGTIDALSSEEGIISFVVPASAERMRLRMFDTDFTDPFLTIDADFGRVKAKVTMSSGSAVGLK